MNNRLCADRILVGNYVISVEAIAFADFDEKEGLLIAIKGQEEPILSSGEEAKAMWEYLTSPLYGCIEPTNRTLWECSQGK